MEVLLCNLSFDRILAILFNIAIILALIHYIVIPLGKSIGNDIREGKEAKKPGIHTQLSTD